MWTKLPFLGSRNIFFIFLPTAICSRQKPNFWTYGWKRWKIPSISRNMIHYISKDPWDERYIYLHLSLIFMGNGRLDTTIHIWIRHGHQSNKKLMDDFTLIHPRDTPACTHDKFRTHPPRCHKATFRAPPLWRLWIATFQKVLPCFSLVPSGKLT